jgi:hypothetical protein
MGDFTLLGAPGRIGERPEDILSIEVRIGCKDLSEFVSGSHKAHYRTHGHARAPDTWFPAHD